MIPAPFSYARAGSVEEAIALLGEHGDEAKVLAGGQSLLPLMKLRLAAPSVLVDLGRVPGLQGVRQEGDVVVVGALTRHRDLERDPLLAERAPLLHHAAGTVGDPQVRSRGTIGGSIAHADPAADYPAVLLALDAEVVVQGPSGTRVVAARDLFVGYFETTLAETELITEVRVPVHDGFGYAKFRRRAQDWAVVGAAAARRDGAITVALMNMGATPVRAVGVEEALAGGASAAEAAARAAEGTSPIGDQHASPDYRRHLATVMARRAVEALAAT